MEFANQFNVQGRADTAVRLAVPGDGAQIMRLLQTAQFQHLHVDWHLPGDWLGTPGFVALTRPSPSPDEAEMTACLAAAPDPAPAAWVRVAALRDEGDVTAVLTAMLESVSPWLCREGVTELGWLAIESWPNPWLPDLGFRLANEIEIYVKEDTAVPSIPTIPDLRIRPVADSDLAQLAALEAKAFVPLWRHSARALQLARSQAASFDVVEMAGEIVGFQLSTRSRHGVHLARMTIDPAWQGQGIGSVLLTHALRGYYRRGLYRVTLNTQIDNIASQRLYRKFGFAASGERIPMWVLDLPNRC
ncbi:MAG TPA: GNAT family N-acetyltransferase [Chloroflexi bacterium]|nr:GNAT family N-acetyltransferase [Chloroflexota bacterium]